MSAHDFFATVATLIETDSHVNATFQRYAEKLYQVTSVEWLVSLDPLGEGRAPK